MWFGELRNVRVQKLHGIYDENDERELRLAEKRNYLQISNAYLAVIHVQVPHHSSTRNGGLRLAALGVTKNGAVLPRLETSTETMTL